MAIPYKVFLFALAFMFVFISQSHALREPRPLTIDGRLKTLTYHPHPSI